MRRRALPLAALLATLSACPAHPPPVPDAGPPDAGPPALPGPGPPPVELTLAIRAHFADGGSGELPVEPGSRPLIDPPSRLDLEANLALVNYRIRLVDEADRVVPSDDRAD